MDAVILAAGRSARMGCQKLLMPLGNDTLLGRICGTVLESGFDNVLAVVSQETKNRLSACREVRYVVNPDPDRGQGSSLRCALADLNEYSSFAIFLGDKPAITVPQILELRRRFEVSSRSALVPFRDGVPGHPSFYDSVWRGRFLDSDEDGREVLLRHPDEIERTAGHESCFFDVDTAADYLRLLTFYESK